MKGRSTTSEQDGVMPFLTTCSAACHQYSRQPSQVLAGEKFRNVHAYVGEVRMRFFSRANTSLV
jgi:hypothetical protein